MWQLIGKLQHATYGDRPGQRKDRRVKMRRGKQRKANHTDVQKRWRKRRNRETVPGVEDRPHQRSQRDQQNIGEGYAQQLRGQRKFIRRISKARCRDHNHPRCGQHPQHGDYRQGQRQQAGNISHKHARGVFALLAFILRENGHKRLRKCPFGKNTSQQVW